MIRNTALMGYFFKTLNNNNLKILKDFIKDFDKDFDKDFFVKDFLKRF